MKLLQQILALNLILGIILVPISVVNAEGDTASSTDAIQGTEVVSVETSQIPDPVEDTTLPSVASSTEPAVPSLGVDPVIKTESPIIEVKDVVKPEPALATTTEVVELPKEEDIFMRSKIEPVQAPLASEFLKQAPISAVPPLRARLSKITPPPIGGLIEKKIIATTTEPVASSTEVIVPGTSDNAPTSTEPMIPAQEEDSTDSIATTTDNSGTLTDDVVPGTPVETDDSKPSELSNPAAVVTKVDEIVEDLPVVEE